MEYPKIETAFKRDEDFKIDSTKLKRPEYDLVKSWQWTEKIDGMNIRVCWDGIGNFTILGRTDKANIPSDLAGFINGCIDLAGIDKFKEVFPLQSAIIYGEGYGVGIQKGGAYSKTKAFAVFDILIDDKYWLNWKDTYEIAHKLGFSTVPFLGIHDLKHAIDWTKEGFFSTLAYHTTGAIIAAEGVVGRTLEPLFDGYGNRLIIKLKTKDF